MRTQSKGEVDAPVAGWLNRTFIRRLIILISVIGIGAALLSYTVIFPYIEYQKNVR